MPPFFRVKSFKKQSCLLQTNLTKLFINRTENRMTLGKFVFIILGEINKSAKSQ